MVKERFWSRMFRLWAARRARMASLSAPPRLVATYVQPINWNSGKGTETHTKEEITFMLLEDGRGRRTYKVHEYGYCKTYEKHKTYSGSVIAWTHGGPLPTYAVRNFGQVLKLTVVK